MSWIYLCNQIEWILMSIYSIMFLVCDHVTAKYFLIQPCKSRDGSENQYSTNSHSMALRGNACAVLTKLALHSTAGPKISKKWKVRLILNFLIWASWMERCINVVFMNLFVNIDKQYQNNCLFIIHFKLFTDGSFKFSLQRGTVGMFLSNSWT